MRTTVPLLLALLSFVSCGADATDAGFRVALLCPGPISDDGWNASAYEGLSRIEAELGADVRHVQVKSPSEFEGAMRSFAGQGFDLVLAHGFEFTEAALAVGAEFPGTALVVTSGAGTRENVSSIRFVIEEPAFLAGMLAASISAAGRIGVVGGMEIPPVKSAFDAFREGAREIRDDVEVVVSWLGSWEDVAAARQAALALLDQGADVLFHNADAAGLGVFLAAEERGVLAIGCNKDQSHVKPGTVVASVVLDVPEAFVRLAREVRDGAHVGRQRTYDLASGVVSLAINPRLEHRVSLVARRRIDQARDERTAAKR
ncbi:MAG: BMP family protein [Planctomycetota bacterium JB042]